MEINGIKTDAKVFAYDGCHKIYLIESEKDEKEALRFGYKILSIKELEKTFDNSCELRFIHDWQLNKSFVNQFEEANFKN